MAESTNKSTEALQAAAEANDYATARIPREKRRSALSITVVLIGFCISMAGLYTGAELSQGLSVSQAVGASLLGNLILTAYAGLVGIIGAREGLGTSMLLRHSFGRYGSSAISLIFALTLVGWYAYQCGFFGNTIHAMFPNAGFITHPVVAGIWGGALMMITAYKGYRGLAALSAIAAPAIFVISIVGLGIATGQIGGWSAIGTFSTEGGATFNSAVVMVVGAFAVGGVIQSDVTRYAKSTTISMGATAVGYMIAHTFVIVAGYMMCAVTGMADVAMAMLLTLGMPSLIVLILAQWTTNDNNLYSSSLALSNIIPQVKKKYIVIALGSVATVLGAFGLANYVAPWLTVLGTFVPPVAGIMIADYYIVNKMKYPFGQGTEYGGVSIPAVIAWLAAAVVGFTVTWGIACINTLVVSLVIYLIIDPLFRRGNVRRCLGGTLRELDDGNTVKVPREQHSNT